MTPCLLAFVADPSAPARRAQLEQAVAGLPAVLGPAVALAGAPRSAERARRALSLRAAGLLPGGGLVIADDHGAELVLQADAALAGDFAEARLAPLAELRCRARSWGNACVSESATNATSTSRPTAEPAAAAAPGMPRA